MSKVNKSQRMTVVLPVPAILREYIISTNGSNVITPQSRDMIWLLVKQHLIVDDGEFKRLTPEEEKKVVYIELLNCRGHKTMTFQSNQNQYPKKTRITKKYNEIYIDTCFRYKLSPTGERVIADFMYRRFKECFHTFIAAQKMANPKKSTSKIIRDFLDMYQIDDNAINEAMLKKSWIRDWRFKYLQSRQKKLLDFGITYCASVI